MSEQKESVRDIILRKIRKMLSGTTERGATLAEAANFAAKAAGWIERYQVDAAELRATGGEGDTPLEVEVCQNKLRTGKRVFNPGTTAVVAGLARGVCCEVILLREGDEAVYGIVGDQLDTDYVCQMALILVSQLQVMANLEGKEHGYEKAGLVRWSNQYLTGAGAEIQQRIERDRKTRSDAKKAEHQITPNNGRALACITGDSLALIKKDATAEAFKMLYPKTKTTHSRAEYDHTAYTRGREAGKQVGLNVSIGGK